MAVTNKHHYRIVLPGDFPSGYWAECKLPETKIKATEWHPAGSKTKKKQPSGIKEVDNIELTYFDDTLGQLDARFIRWARDCAGGKTPDECMLDFNVEQVDTDGSVVHIYECKRAFFMSGLAFEGKSGDEAAVEKKVVIAVEDVVPIR